MLARQSPTQILDIAISALGSGDAYRSVIDDLPVPIYLATDNGVLTYWNPACVDFAGRVPEPGKDRWCITWKIYSTTGEFVPHDQCPMAEAIKERRPVRDRIAIAERPDGSRVAFKPYPTPLFDRTGQLTGALNMLIDVTEEQSLALHEQAERCRRLAGATYDRSTSKVLDEMAASFDETAETLTVPRK